MIHRRGHDQSADHLRARLDPPAIDAVSGSRAFGLTDNGSVSQVTADVRGLGAGVGAAEGAFGRFGATVGSSLGRSDESTLGLQRSVDGLGSSAMRADAAASGMSGSLSTMVAPVQQLSAVMAGGGGALAENSASAASGLGDIESGMSRTGRTAGLTASQIQSVSSALDSGSLVQGFQAFDSALSGTGGPPGPPPRRGGGGGGGGGGDSLGGGGTGLSDLEKKALKPDLGMLKSGAMIGAVVGVASEAVAAGAGLLAVAADIKAVPALAGAATAATNQFDQGLRGAGKAAAGFAPEIRALSPELQALGGAFGSLGAAAMPAALAAAPGLITSTTAALQNLTPAVGPAVTGLANVAEGAIKGLSSPSVAKGITDLGNALSSPAVQSGTASLVSSIVGGATELTAKAAPIIGAVGALGSGQAYAAHSGGTLGYDPSQDQGGAPVPGGGGGVSWNQGSGFGRVMTALGATGTLAGTVGEDAVANSWRDMGAAAHGDMSGYNRDTAQLKSAGRDFAQRWGAVGGGGGSGAGAGGGGTASADQRAAAQLAAPFGYAKDPKTGDLTVSAGKGGGGGVYAGGPGSSPGQTTPTIPAPWPGGVNPAGPRPGQLMGGGAGGGSSVGALSPAQVSALNAPTQQLSSSMSQLGQNSAAAAAPIAQVSQHATSASSSVSQLSQNATQAMAPLKQVAPTASAGLASASSAIQSSSRSLGQSVPTAMASGVSANTGQACDAANQMGKSAVNCAADALKSASPSREFFDLGMGTGQGFAGGSAASAGLASGAVSQAMTGAVSAGAAALGAQSPSREFNQLGQGLVNQVTQGAQGQMGAAQSQLNKGLGGLKTQIPGTAGQGQGSIDFGGAYAANANSQQAQAQQAAQAIQQAHTQTRDRLSTSTEKAQRDAQTRAFGSSNIDPATGQPMDHSQRAAKLRDDVTKRHQDALNQAAGRNPALDANNPNRSWLGQQNANRRQDSLDARGQGLSSWGVAQNRQNAALGAGAMNSPIPSSAVLLPQNNNMQQQAQQQGNQVGQNLTQGLQQGTPAAVNAAGAMGTQSINQLKKNSGSNSPSVYANQVGLDVGAGYGNGLGASMVSASAAIQPIASNSGLQVGYAWARGVLTGSDSVIKSSDYGSAAVTGVGSQLAEAALGQLHMLGPAGSGGEIGKVLPVTVGSVTPTVTIAAVNVQVGDQQLQGTIQSVVDANMSGLTTAIGMQ